MVAAFWDWKIHFKRDYILHFDSFHSRLYVGLLAEANSVSFHPTHLGQQGMTWGPLNRRQPLTYLSHVLRWYKGTERSSSSADTHGGPSTSTDTQHEAAGSWPWTQGSSFCYRGARKGSSTFFPLASPLAWTWPIPEHPWARASDLKGPHRTRMSMPRALFLSVLTQQITKAGIQQEGGMLLKEDVHQTFLQTSL